MAKRALVTGAAGFIGSHLVEYLVEAGFEVRAMLRYSSLGNKGNLDFVNKHVLQQVEFVRGDLKDPEFCHQVVQGCSYIFHLGALISIPYSYQNPTDYIQTNVLGTTYLLNAARNSDCLERFIHTSSSEVYGTAQYIPIDELHPLHPQSPYAASKVGADMLVKSYQLSFDLPATIIRPFNTYGPRQSTRAVIPTIITQLLQGPQVELGMLSPKRDFLFVKDTVKGFVEVGTHKASLGEALNLGTGQAISIQDLVDLIGEVMDEMGLLKKADVEVLQKDERLRPKKSEVFHLVADVSKSKQLTGWLPHYTIKQGLEHTIEWLQKWGKHEGYRV